MSNIDLGKTRITDKIRVSSAAIYYDNAFFGNYYQLETFIFSDDERQKTRQIIHYTTSRVTDKDKERIAIIHSRIVVGLVSKFKAYKNYEITTGGLGYLYVHNDYDGVYEYDGETGDPSEYDERSGSAYTLQQAMEEIDEIEERRRERQEERDLRNGNRLPDFEINYER